MKRFTNDWPTQALAMQLLKNKRSHSYRRGYLEVPEKYAYLKDNATKKKAEASHNAGAEEGGNSNNNADSDSIGQKSKRVAPVPVAAQPPRKKQKKGLSDGTNTRSTTKSKGKVQKVSLAAESEEDYGDEMQQETDGVGAEE